MKKLLLTGFESFLNFNINPTTEIVHALNEEKINGYQIIGKILPVDYQTSGDNILSYMEEIQPDAVVSLGLAIGRNRVTPERIGINCNQSSEPDNAGNQPMGEKINADGPDGLFSTLPIQEMVDQLQEAGYPATISNTAGTYVCNHVMYRILNHLQKSNTQVPAGFIHIPASHEMAVDQNRIPSWSQEDLTEAIRVCLGCMD